MPTFDLRAETPSTNLRHEPLVLPQSSAHGAFGGHHDFLVHPHARLRGTANILVLGRVESLKGEVFKTGAKVVYTEPVRQRGVDVQGIVSKLLTVTTTRGEEYNQFSLPKRMP